MSTDLAYSEWTGGSEAAEEEFVKGRPAAFQALWSQNDDVTPVRSLWWCGTRMAQRQGSAQLGQCEFRWHAY